MTTLIVNADDYGLTEATSQAILDCHVHGVVTSTSLLTLAPGFERSAPWLTEHPDLGVGVHLALVGEDPPLLSASEIPTLVDGSGRLPISWRQFCRRAITGRIDRADVERELSAQVDLALATGVTLTHLDSHQHLHEWPTLWPVIERLAERAGVRAIRSTASRRPTPVGMLGRWTARRARVAGIATTDSFVGFEHSGSLTTPTLLRLIESLPAAGAVELGCHPGARSDAERVRYDWGFRWAEESDALRSAEVRSALDERGVQLATFGDLGAAPTA